MPADLWPNSRGIAGLNGRSRLPERHLARKSYTTTSFLHDFALQFCAAGRCTRAFSVTSLLANILM
jgi:hypothetical protein